MATDPESYCEQIRVMASYIDELCYLSGDTNNDFRNGRDQRYHINYNLWTINDEEQTVGQ